MIVLIAQIIVHESLNNQSKQRDLQHELLFIQVFKILNLKVPPQNKHKKIGIDQIKRLRKLPRGLLITLRS